MSLRGLTVIVFPTCGTSLEAECRWLAHMARSSGMAYIGLDHFHHIIECLFTSPTCTSHLHRLYALYTMKLHNSRIEAQNTSTSLAGISGLFGEHPIQVFPCCRDLHCQASLTSPAGARDAAPYPRCMLYLLVLTIFSCGGLL